MRTPDVTAMPRVDALTHDPATAGDERVCAIVITYERPELLGRCLDALLAQSRHPDHVLVVDNASRDGTGEMVRDRFGHAVELLELPENVGGAGGFYAGMRAAYERGFGWLWLMDDDSLPTVEALERLLDGAHRAPGDGPPLVVGSRVVWKNGRNHPMNNPWPRWRWPLASAAAVRQRLVLVRATTFVSALVRREAVERFGLPLAHYFIWGDDMEYFGRMLRENPGYLVPDSVVYHWTAKPHTGVSHAGGRFYYHVRNSLWIVRGSAFTPRERVDYLRGTVGTTGQYLRANGSKFSAWRAVARGARDGLRGSTR